MNQNTDTIARKNPKITLVILGSIAFLWALKNVPGFGDAAAQVIVLLLTIFLAIKGMKNK